jgi:CRP-like cAMP-binding protein
VDLYQEAEQLKKVPMFSKLEASKLRLMAFTSEAVEFHDKEFLFHVDDPSDSAYVIMSGEVEILVETDEGMVPVVTRGKNEIIGEMAVLTNLPRSATLRAKGPVRTLRISNEAFIKLLTESPEVCLDVMRQLSLRLAESTDMMKDLNQEVERLRHRLHEAGLSD